MELSLNNGSITPECLEEFINNYYDENHYKISQYTSKYNNLLTNYIAEINHVNSNNVFISAGSGPCLNFCIPLIFKKTYKENIFKYLRARTSKKYGLTTLKFTYSKVPSGAKRHGIPLNFIDIGPENDFNVKLSTISDYLHKYKSVIFYIVNPNNPDGKLKLTRSEIKGLCNDFPDTNFVIDEAYIEFCEDWENITMAPFVNEFKNLFVSRSMSFAYGIAGLRVGYWISNSEMTTLFKKDSIGYNIGTFQQDCALHVLRNRQSHLKKTREHVKKEIEIFKKELQDYPINSWYGQSNYILFRFNTPQFKGEDIKKYMEENGVLIKELEDYHYYDFSRYFRITIGSSEQNKKAITLVKDFFDKNIMKTQILSNNHNVFTNNYSKRELFSLKRISIFLLTLPLFLVCALLFFIVTSMIILIDKFLISINEIYFIYIVSKLISFGLRINLKIRDYNDCEDSHSYIFCCAHHNSFCDGHLLTQINKNTSVIATKAIHNQPLLGYVMKKADAIFIDREKKNNSSIVINELKKKKKKYIIFPEGVMTKNEALLKFRSTIFRTGLPITPVVFNYSQDITFYRGQESLLVPIYKVLSQFYTTMNVDILPVYYPNEKEKNDHELYSANVQKVMADYMKLPIDNDTNYKDSSAYKFDIIK